MYRQGAAGVQQGSVGKGEGEGDGNDDGGGGGGGSSKQQPRSLDTRMSWSWSGSAGSTTGTYGRYVTGASERRNNSSAAAFKQQQQQQEAAAHATATATAAAAGGAGWGVSRDAGLLGCWVLGAGCAGRVGERMRCIWWSVRHPRRPPPWHGRVANHACSEGDGVPSRYLDRSRGCCLGRSLPPRHAASPPPPHWACWCKGKGARCTPLNSNLRLPTRPPLRSPARSRSPPSRPQLGRHMHRAWRGRGCVHV